MKNTFGQSVCVTIWGESHGNAIGAVIDGLSAGIKIDEAFIKAQMDKRRAYGKISTPRREEDQVILDSGVFNSMTTGTPIAIRIMNNNTKSEDYQKGLIRPSHADFVASEKYHGFEDFRGGGHFSGRLTAPIVALGAIALDILRHKGIHIATHIKRCAGIDDIDFSDNVMEDIALLNEKIFATLSDEKGEEMKEAIESASRNNTSVGGVLETVVLGMPTGVGEPFFDSVESCLSHILFSMPAVKGVEFGKGFAISDMTGEVANDPVRIENGKVITTTNNSGGINGGITNGMPIIFRCAIRPTPTIAQEQETIDLVKMENATISAKGRHDPCIVHRARVVQDSLTALALLDLLSVKFGTDWMAQ